ncbi:hypothetical protein KCP73_03755 [Salmonella enterica subsp. enterica]|nr:hypothetical protein KCP73_03755 [Salmonella enterica subsp. enterica]
MRICANAGTGGTRTCARHLHKVRLGAGKIRSASINRYQFVVGSPLCEEGTALPERQALTGNGVNFN